MVSCARKLFCYKSDPCRVPALSHSGLAWASLGTVHREGRQFYLLQFQASCNGDVCPDCPVLIQQQESANHCFSKAAMQTQECEEGALNKLYFLGIIVRKKLSFGGSQSFQISFFCLILSSSGKVCLSQVRKCL